MEELIKLAVKYGYDDMCDAWKDGLNTQKLPGRYTTHFSPMILAVALDRYLVENGVEVILDCMATYPVMENGNCNGVIAETKEGCVFYGAKAVIDATGDASIFAQAGLPTENGENYLTYVAHGYNSETIAHYQSSDIHNMNHMRKWLHYGSDLFGNGHPDGMPRVAGVTAEEITWFVMTGRQMLFDEIKEQERNERDVSAIPFMPQFRTIRKIKGAFDFQAIDREVYEDTIGSCGDFRPIGKGKHFHIPYRSLYNDECSNILAAGRIISADKEGWEVSRVIPTCALTGQAAGAATAVACRGNGDIRDIDYSELKKILLRNNVLFVE